MNIHPRNLTAQLHHRARGNPETTLPHTAISNCFPGLEYDFRNLWRRVFVGLVLLENNNYVVGFEDPKYKDLVGHRLLRVDEQELLTTVSGPVMPGDDLRTLTSGTNPAAVVFMEWSNALAHLLHGKQGCTVKGFFTKDKSPEEVPIPKKADELMEVELTVRRLFEADSIAPSLELVNPGEMTQSLCSPWQNDYRECACYYWAASRPDFVNVESGVDGLAHGDNWMTKERTGEYLPDDRDPADTRLISYDDLFRDWQRYLQFQIRGHDAEET
jgi:hypothetical protein